MNVPRRIDHLVVAVRDLDGAGRFYERLGFQVGARNRHPWGTENRLVQFPGSFIELITLDPAAALPEDPPGQFGFGAFIRGYLARREGLALLVLDSTDARADAAAFAAAGIGAFDPFFFERRGVRPDGSEVHVAFTLAFAQAEAAPELGFFVCQQHFPENFWNPAFQQHPNEATGIDAVVLAVDSSEPMQAFLEAFSGAAASRPGLDDLTVPLAHGRIDVLTPDDAAALLGSIEVEAHRPAFVAYAVQVADLERQAIRLAGADIPHQRFGSRLLVPASAAHGVAIAFEEA